MFELSAEFFDDLEFIRGRSRNTVQAYRRDLELFEKYRRTRTDIAGFYKFMSRHGLSSRTQARVVSALRSYFKFIESRGGVAPELRDLKAPKIKHRLPRALTPNEFNKLFASCEAESAARTSQNRMMLLLLYGLGLRVSELVSLNVSDFHVTGAWLSVVGKGNKERAMPLPEHLVSELKLYLNDARPLIADAKEASILVNNRGHRPSRMDVWRWIFTWASKAGLEGSMGPHRFRHGYATALLDAGADLRSIQKLLGHASIQTTQIYTSVSVTGMADAIDRFHPLSGFQIEEA